MMLDYPHNSGRSPNFSYTPSSGQASLTVTLDGTTSSASSGSISSYNWSSSDGQSATGSTTSFTFGSAGSYTVTLTVTDSDGLTNSSSQTVTVEAPNLHIATYSINDNILTIPSIDPRLFTK